MGEGAGSELVPQSVTELKLIIYYDACLAYGKLQLKCRKSRLDWLSVCDVCVCVCVCAVCVSCGERWKSATLSKCRKLQRHRRNHSESEKSLKWQLSFLYQQQIVVNLPLLLLLLLLFVVLVVGLMLYALWSLNKQTQTNIWAVARPQMGFPFVIGPDKRKISIFLLFLFKWRLRRRGRGKGKREGEEEERRGRLVFVVSCAIPFTIDLCNLVRFLIARLAFPSHSHWVTRLARE